MSAARWRWAVFAVGWLALCALTLRWCAQPSEYQVAHDATVKAALDALDAYRRQHGRYPKDLRGLLAGVPPGVEIRYASTESGDTCWVAYDTPHTLMPSDTFIEHQCGTRERRVLEYGDAKTTPGPGVTTFP